MDKPIPEAVRNPNIAVIEQARDTFPEGHYLRGALDHAAAEMAVLSNRLRRADATAARQQGQAVAWEYLGTSSLAGPWPTPEWKPCDDPDAARAAGYEVRQKPMQQGGGEVVCPYSGKPCLCRAPRGKCKACTAPPSAPVGVEARAFALWHPERKEYGNVIVGDPSLLREDYKEHGYVIVALAQQPAAVDGVRTLDEWHEDCGPVVWWKLPVDEPAWIGTPNDSDWPGYHTHWTPHPSCPPDALATQHQEPTT